MGKLIRSAQVGDLWRALCCSLQTRRAMSKSFLKRREKRETAKWPLSGFALTVAIIAIGSFALESTVLHVRNSQLAAAAIEPTSKDCDTAKQAAAKGISSGSQSGTGSEIIDDKCISAVFDQSKVQPNEQNPRQNPKNYKCAGKSVKVSVDSKGKVTESWNASAGVPQGYCQTQYCDANGCKATEPTPGIGNTGEKPSEVINNPSLSTAERKDAAYKQLSELRNEYNNALTAARQQLLDTAREYDQKTLDKLREEPDFLTRLSNIAGRGSSPSYERWLTNTWNTSQAYQEIAQIAHADYQNFQYTENKAILDNEYLPRIEQAYQTWSGLSDQAQIEQSSIPTQVSPAPASINTFTAPAANSTFAQPNAQMQPNILNTVPWWQSVINTIARIWPF